MAHSMSTSESLAAAATSWDKTDLDVWNHIRPFVLDLTDENGNLISPSARDSAPSIHRAQHAPGDSVQSHAPENIRVEVLNRPFPNTTTSNTQDGKSNQNFKKISVPAVEANSDSSRSLESEQGGLDKIALDPRSETSDSPDASESIFEDLYRSLQTRDMPLYDTERRKESSSMISHLASSVVAYGVDNQPLYRYHTNFRLATPEHSSSSSITRRPSATYGVSSTPAHALDQTRSDHNVNPDSTSLSPYSTQRVSAGGSGSGAYTDTDRRRTESLEAYHRQAVQGRDAHGQAFRRQTFREQAFEQQARHSQRAHSLDFDARALQCPPVPRPVSQQRLQWNLQQQALQQQTLREQILQEQILCQEFLNRESPHQPGLQDSALQAPAVHTRVVQMQQFASEQVFDLATRRTMPQARDSPPAIAGPVSRHTTAQPHQPPTLPQSWLHHQPYPQRPIVTVPPVAPALAFTPTLPGTQSGFPGTAWTIQEFEAQGGQFQGPATGPFQWIGGTKECSGT